MEISVGNKQLHENKHSQRHSQSSQHITVITETRVTNWDPELFALWKKPSSWDGAVTLAGHMCDSVCVGEVRWGCFWNTWISFDLISSWISFHCSWNLFSWKKKKITFLSTRRGGDSESAKKEDFLWTCWRFSGTVMGNVQTQRRMVPNEELGSLARLEVGSQGRRV